MEADADRTDQILALLSKGPQRLVSMTKGIDPLSLHSADGEEWSVRDILAHLRACADIWGKSIMSMLAKDQPRITYVSPRTWMRKTDSLTQEFPESLVAYVRQRNELVDTLRALTVDQWSRSATIKTASSVRTQIVCDYAQRIADYEQQHLEQVEAVLRA